MAPEQHTRELVTNGPSGPPPKRRPLEHHQKRPDARHELRFFYRHDLDVEVWEQEWSAGKRPGRLPYGLHELSKLTSAVAFERLPERVPGVHEVVGGMLRHRDSRSLAVVWDELGLSRVIASPGHSSIGCGIIWATDEYHHSPRSARVQATRALLRSVSFAWVLSRAQLETATKLTARSSLPISWLKFGIDTDYFSRKVEEKRPLVIAVGNDRDRDLDALAQVVASIQRHAPHATTIIQSQKPVPIGGPRVSVRTQIPPHELRDLYACASVNLVLTRHNLHVSGMTTTLEALASGTPTIALNTPGFSDYLPDGEAGYLVRSPTEASECALQLLSEPDLASRLGRAGAAYVRREHTQEQMVTSLLRLARASGWHQSDSRQGRT